MIELLGQLWRLHPDRPIKIVLDNAAYQRVMAMGWLDAVRSEYFINGNQTFNNIVGNNIFNYMSLLARYNVPNDAREWLWVPGDWGYVKNVATYEGVVAGGLEGENIIYLGNGVFWGHYTTKLVNGNPPTTPNVPSEITTKSLADWKDMVGRWGNDGLGNGPRKGSEVLLHRDYPWLGLTNR